MSDGPWTQARVREHEAWEQRYKHAKAHHAWRQIAVRCDYCVIGFDNAKERR